MDEEAYENESYHVKIYPTLRVGWLIKGNQVGFILNPFNFHAYGTTDGNIISQKIINILSEEFRNKPISVETLIEADKWVQDYGWQFSAR